MLQQANQDCTKVTVKMHWIKQLPLLRLKAQRYWREIRTKRALESLRTVSNSEGVGAPLNCWRDSLWFGLKAKPFSLSVIVYDVLCPSQQHVDGSADLSTAHGAVFRLWASDMLIYPSGRRAAVCTIYARISRFREQRDWIRSKREGLYDNLDERNKRRGMEGERCCLCSTKISRVVIFIFNKTERLWIKFHHSSMIQDTRESDNGRYSEGGQKMCRYIHWEALKMKETQTV